MRTRRNTIFKRRYVSSELGELIGYTLLDKKTKKVLIHIDQGDRWSITLIKGNWHLTLVQEVNHNEKYFR